MVVYSIISGSFFMDPTWNLFEELNGISQIFLFRLR